MAIEIKTVMAKIKSTLELFNVLYYAFKLLELISIAMLLAFRLIERLLSHVA